MQTCSLTEIELQKVTSDTSTLLSMAACRSTWSEPIPAVMAIFRLGADAMRLALQ